MQIVDLSGTDGIPGALSLLAHQGGWDEVLFVAAPLVVFAGLLVVAKRRASVLADDDLDDPPGSDEPVDR